MRLLSISIINTACGSPTLCTHSINAVYSVIQTVDHMLLSYIYVVDIVQLYTQVQLVSHACFSHQFLVSDVIYVEDALMCVCVHVTACVCIVIRNIITV